MKKKMKFNTKIFGLLCLAYVGPLFLFSYLVVLYPNKKSILGAILLAYLIFSTSYISTRRKKRMKNRYINNK